MAMIIVLASKQCIWNDNPECDRLLGYTNDTAITVPQELESAAKECCPYCELVIEDGQLIDIIALPRPEPEPPAPPEPSDMELTQQDITDLQLANIEMGQEITDLQIALMEVTA